ncbi:hypothetical protein [Streptomyces sp. NPDC002328]|uniref:hypothetical protein n=1 Tax=Streptomyces sp. NPDC002328 TaxID=3364642 RepID=UPI003684C674
MRRTARVLSVAAVGAAVLAGAVPDASAEPTAEIGPATVAPGGSITVSVTCDPLGGPAPGTLDATSRAFDGGTVTLTLVPGGDELTGPAYRGTARIALAEDLTVPVDDTDGATDAPVDDLSDGGVTGAAGAAEAAATRSAWTVDGTCPAPSGGRGAPWSAAFGVSESEADALCARDKGCTTPEPCDDDHLDACGTSGTPQLKPEPEPEPEPEPDSEAEAESEPGFESGSESEPCPGYTRGSGAHDDSCAGAAVEHGVRAGTGGAFTDSVPTLVAGGLLIAGAFGAAVHRLRRRDSAGRV